MNIQLSTVLRDITGRPGIRVIEAVLLAEREAKVLAELISIWVRINRAANEKALVGYWREEYLF